jgi:flap endonuclease-1
MFKEARELFIKPNVNRNLEELSDLIKWDKPDETSLKLFLVEKKGFSEAKVESGLKKLKGTLT